MATTISIRFALDQNRNRQVEPEEIVRDWSQLSVNDSDHNQKLGGRELKDIYFEYGKDVWLPADETSYLRKDGWLTTVKLNEIDLQNRRLDMKINMSPA